MGRLYNQLSRDERHRLSFLHQEGASIRKIATALDRSPSTIARELKRNSGRDTGYQPEYAHKKTKARRWSGLRLDRDHDLRAQVLGLLKAGLSPEQVSGTLRRKNAAKTVSYETIYRFIYAQTRRTNKAAWKVYLPRNRSKRRRRGRVKFNPVDAIKHRVAVQKRPKRANNRTQVGHWEADLMLFSQYGDVILVAQERTSRLLLMSLQPNKTAQNTVNQLIHWFETLPSPMRLSCTFDNGTEFANHWKLNTQINMDTYFCDVRAPWQKGGVENAIGRMRRWLPRKTNLATLNQDQINTYISIFNNTPRKCLDFKTPAEVFSKKLLHFKCESTPTASTGMSELLGGEILSTLAHPVERRDLGYV